MFDLPAEITAGLIALAVAVLAVGVLIVRSYGKLVSANLELSTAKQEHEKAELGNQSKLEALAVQVAENNARQNTMLQDTITNLTAEFSRQTGDLSGQLKGEHSARITLEAKFENLSEQKVETSHQLLLAREALASAKAQALSLQSERDKLKADLDALSLEMPKLRTQVQEAQAMLEAQKLEMVRQAQKITELEERQKARHEQLNVWQADEMERKAELDIARRERDGLIQRESKLRLELSAAHEALGKANEHLQHQTAEIAELKRQLPLVAVSDMSVLPEAATTAGVQ